MVISDLLYFVEGLNRTYLSKDTMEQLRIIPKNFLLAGATAIEGRPTEDNDNTNDLASREARVVGGSSQVSRGYYTTIIEELQTGSQRPKGPIKEEPSQ